MPPCGGQFFFHFYVLAGFFSMTVSSFEYVPWRHLGWLNQLDVKLLFELKISVEWTFHIFCLIRQNIFDLQLCWTSFNFFLFFYILPFTFCFVCSIMVIVEGGTTKGTTALLYNSIHSSLYTGTVHCVQGCLGTRPTGLTVNQGCSWSPPGSNWALASAGRRRGQRSNLWGGDRWRYGYRCCGDRDGASGPGCAKNRSAIGKTVPGPSLGGVWEEEGEETSGSENQKCLVEAGLPRHLPESRLQCRGLPRVVSTSVQALRRLTETISSQDLTLMVKERDPCSKTA